MYHKRLTINHVHEARCSRGTSLRLTQPPLHRFAEFMHHKRVTMELASKTENHQRSFRRVAGTSTRAACATQRLSVNVGVNV